MTESEGVIKYRLAYTPGPLPAAIDLGPLFDWFGRCRALGLIGRDPRRYAGAAYGNISRRHDGGFVISGTQTGDRPALCADDLAWVQGFDTATNRVRATGPSRPSSEAMTHGQIYQRLADVDAVIHVHSPLIWRHAHALDLPTTAPDAAYGTPEMAAEVNRLLADASPNRSGIFAMGGHEDGIVAYAPTMDAAGKHLLATLADAQRLG